MDLDQINYRLETVERQNRRIKTVTFAMAAALLMPWMLGAVVDSRNQTIHGRRFVLTDGKGKLRVFLGADEDDEGRVGLYLYDQLGKRSAALYVKKGNSGLALYGEGNQERGRLELREQDVRLTLYDGDGQEGTTILQGQTLSQLILGVQTKNLDQDTDLAKPSNEQGNINLSTDSRQEGISVISMGNRLAGSHIELKSNQTVSHLSLRNQDRRQHIELSPAIDRPSIRLNASASGPSVAILDGEGEVVGSLP